MSPEHLGQVKNYRCVVSLASARWEGVLQIMHFVFVAKGGGFCVVIVSNQSVSKAIKCLGAPVI